MMADTISTASLAADANSSALDKLETFLEKNATEPPKKYDEAIISTAFSIGGATLAHAHRLYLTWFDQSFRDSIQLFAPDWEKQRKQNHPYCDCGQFPLSDRLILIGWGQHWSLSLNYKTQELRLFDQTSMGKICTNETLEQLFVGYLLNSWQMPNTFDYIPDVWFDKNVLDNSSEWELLWCRPSYVYRPCIVYLHTSKQLMLTCSGQFDEQLTTLSVGQQSEVTSYWLAQTIQASEELFPMNVPTEKTVLNHRYCEKCMDIPF